MCAALGACDSALGALEHEHLLARAKLGRRLLMTLWRRRTAARGKHAKLRPTPGDAGCVHPDSTAKGMVGRWARPPTPTFTSGCGDAGDLLLRFAQSLLPTNPHSGNPLQS